MNIKRIFVKLSVVLLIICCIDTQRINAQEKSVYDLWKEQQVEIINTSLTKDIKRSKLGDFSVINNPYLGLEIKAPKNWEADLHAGYNHMRFFNKEFRVDISSDKIDSEKYINKEYIYGHTLDMLKGYTTLTEKKMVINGKNVLKVSYYRPILKGIENDLTAYTYYFVEVNNYIYTVQVKAHKYKKGLYDKLVEELISRISFFEPSSFIDYAKVKTTSSYTPTVSAKKQNIKIAPGKLMAGAYPANEKDFQTLNKDSGNKMTIRAAYKSITSSFDGEITRFSNQGSVPMISMLFEKAGKRDNTIMLETIKGSYDKSLYTWADGVKKTQGTVMFRIGNEMNGNWSKWGPGYNYNDPDLYQLAYDRIYSIFKLKGVTNAKFIFNPNGNSSPDLNWNDSVLYYPGSKKTDYIGLTAYNYGSTDKQPPNNFLNLYTPIYNKMVAKFIGKPLIICETGAVEETSAPKNLFIKDLFNLPQVVFPEVKIVCWFNIDHPPYKLRLNTSKSSYEEFKKIKNNQNILTLK